MPTSEIHSPEGRVQGMKIVSVRDNPEMKDTFIAYFQKIWANEASRRVYEDCIAHCIATPAPLPQWYLLMDGETIAGCAGLITNDFISRMDLYPWACALFIEEAYRGHAYGSLLLERARTDARRAGFTKLYLCSDHVGYYERYGFRRIGVGYHPWGESSGIFEAEL
ncbi:N-acetylglutamate synthase [Longilinea arvoryzae]|uniref:N-acetylglutamate synthase n=2 Tax=Longilinea arvoryzae TaxID=360412 RepID=A0A0S7BBZ9_9CHLR|nr:GNAT family N-acetyltransferase [Longilinea arvoryzae]GAP12665.1 N-acetylglutamate synthase [Longilinea arvoryzae]